MKLSAILLLLITGACAQDPADPAYPLSTPGATGASGGGGGGGNARVSGRVCVLADPQIMSACAINGAQGLSVALGSATATTSADGTFTIDRDPTLPATTPISVTGNTIVQSNATLATGNGPTVIPAMTTQLYDNMTLATGITPAENTGAIVANVATGEGLPATGITATSTPTGTAGPFFDATGESPWSLNATGARGIVYFPNVTTTGPSSLTFTDPTTAGETTVDGIQVVNGGITYVDASLQ